MTDFFFWLHVSSKTNRTEQIVPFYFASRSGGTSKKNLPMWTPPCSTLLQDTAMNIPCKAVIRNLRFSAHSCSSYYHEPFTERTKKVMKFLSFQLQLRTHKRNCITRVSRFHENLNLFSQGNLHSTHKRNCIGAWPTHNPKLCWDNQLQQYAQKKYRVI
jgi:hypothetical protein